MPRASSPFDVPGVSGSVTPTAASFAWAIASGGSIAAARDALDSPVRSPSDSTASTSPRQRQRDHDLDQGETRLAAAHVTAQTPPAR